MQSLKSFLKNRSLNESSLNRLRDKAEKFDVGTISAFRKYEGSGDEKRNIFWKENMEKTRVLKADIIKEGFHVTEIKGHYIENEGTADEVQVEEVSFFVSDEKKKGNLKEVLVKLGKKFNQETILFKPLKGDVVFVYCDTKKEEVLGSGNITTAVTKFYSKIGNRKWMFEKVLFDISKNDLNIASLRSLEKGSLTLDLEKGK